jgi:hypothetical protein
MIWVECMGSVHWPKRLQAVEVQPALENARYVLLQGGATPQCCCNVSPH